MATGRRINTKVVSDILTGAVLERESYQELGAIARAMGVRFATVASTTQANVLPANATETVICTTLGINEAVDNAQVVLVWMSNITTGTGTTALVHRIRRGTAITGTSIGFNTWINSVTAGNTVHLSGVYVDSPGIVAGQQYSMTVQQTGATAAGGLNDVCLLAMVL